MLYRDQPPLAGHLDLAIAREAVGFLTAELFAVKECLPTFLAELSAEQTPRLYELTQKLLGNRDQYNQNGNAIWVVKNSIADHRATTIRVGPKPFTSAVEGVAWLAWQVRGQLKMFCEMTVAIREGKLLSQAIQPYLDSLNCLVGDLDFDALDVELDSEFRRTAARRTSNPEQRHYVDLDQIAAVVNRSKSCLEKLKRRKKNPLPDPDVSPGGGRKHEWLWARIRPWLEAEFNKHFSETCPRRL